MKDISETNPSTTRVHRRVGVLFGRGAAAARRRAHHAGGVTGPGYAAPAVAIADELPQDGLVLRYRVEGTDTGFPGEEGTFTICSFWLVTALAMIGETERAHALCQKLLSFRRTAAAPRGGD